MDKHLRETRVDSSTVYDGDFLKVQKDRVMLPNGAHSEREYIKHPGAVVILPVLDDGSILIERQYRYPLQQVMIEFPAGKLDPGEDTFACARRELLEETGYTAREWSRAGVLHPVLAYSNEFIEIWFARGLTLGERQLDAGEFLDVINATPDELAAWCRDGQVTDSKTLSGMLWLQNFLSGAWALEWRPAPGATAVR